MGQSRNNFEEILFDFTDGDGQVYTNNKVKYRLALTLGSKDSLSQFLSKDNVILDCNGARRAKIALEVVGLEWGTKDPEFIQKSELVLSPKFVVSGPELDFIKKSAIKIKQKSGGKGLPIFQVLGNGNGKFSLEFHVATPNLSINKIKDRNSVFIVQNEYEIIDFFDGKNREAPIANAPAAQIDTLTDNSKASPDEAVENIAEDLEEEQLWATTKFQSNAKAFEAYLIKYPDGTHKKEATFNIQKYSPIKYSVQFDNNRYDIHVENVNNPEIQYHKLDSNYTDNFQIFADQFKTTHKFAVLLKENGRYEIPIIDTWGKKGAIDLDKVLYATLDSVDQANNYHITFSGGVKPYRIDFKRQHTPIVEHRKTDINKEQLTLTQQELIEAGLKGTYSLEVFDERASAMVYLPLPIVVEQPFQMPLLAWIGMGFVGFLVLFLVLRSLLKRRQPKKQQALEEKRKQALEANMKSVELSNIGKQTLTHISKREPQNKSKAGALPSKIKIKNLDLRSDRNNDISPEEFDEMIGQGMHQKLDIGELWDNSAISEVHMNHKCIDDLAAFLKGDQSNSGREEEEGFTPEIGGFLLGQYAFYENDTDYKVSLEEFVPITPESHTVFQLEFSTKSLVKELGDAQDRFPHLSVLGWFHTHPGHGLFLSKPDLVIHKGFFREKYQLAMEIDNLSENMDTGFFTRTKQGRINNSLTARVNWFSWIDITDNIKT